MQTGNETGGRKTILLVNHVGCVSGAEESLLSLAQAIDRSRFKLLAACPDGPLKRRFEQADVEVFRIRFRRLKRSRNPFRLLRWGLRWRRVVRRLRNAIQQHDVDIVHANSTEAHLHAGSAAARFGIPCIWHVRDSVSLFPLAGALTRRAHKVVAISDAVAEHLARERIERHKIVRIYNGLDIEAFRGMAKAETSPPWEEGDRPVLMVAQLVPWKRHEDFIRAMARVVHRCPDARGVLVGPDLFGDHPGYFNALKSLARRAGIADRVTFAGQRADVASLIRRSEMLVLPSDGEPFGRVAIEAMALGKPVIGTNAGGLPEVVLDGETGLLVPVSRPDLLAESIVGLLKNRETATRLGEAGRLRVEQCFRADGTARQIESLYDELTSGERA